MGRAEEMNCMMTLVVLSMAMAAGAPYAYAEPPTVRTAAEAIVVAKRLCAPLIPSDRTPSDWTAVLGDGHEIGRNSPGGVWRVDVAYDDSRGNTMSSIDMYIFIPKDGKPSECFRLSN
jgi:hypothetical protein